MTQRNAAFKEIDMTAKLIHRDGRRTAEQRAHDMTDYIAKLIETTAKHWGIDVARNVQGTCLHAGNKPDQGTVVGQQSQASRSASKGQR